MRQFNDGAGGGAGQGRRRGRSSRVALRALLGLVLLAGFGASDGGATTGTGPGQPPAAAGPPRLAVEVDEIDLGDLPKGSSAVASFELRNDGESILRILSAKTGCSCTVADYDETIRPGEVGLLRATLHTLSLDGEVGKGITLETNDPESPFAFLTVRATVVTAVRVLPDKRIILRNYGESSRVRRLLRRSADSGHGFFNITGLRANAPWIAVRARKVRDPTPATDDLPAASTGDWVLEIELRERAPYGRGSQEVEFKTGLERQPLVKLSVLTEIAEPVELPIDRLLLSPGAGPTGDTLAFSVREGLDPAALSVDAQPEGLSVELQPGEGRSVTAHVRWKGGLLEGGRLTFRIAGEELEIPVALASSG